MLFISSRFPPVASVGAIRIRKFVKYLGEFGWRPVVLTIDIEKSTGSERPQADWDSVRDIPVHTPVIRLAASRFENPASYVEKQAFQWARWSRMFGANERWLGDRLGWRMVSLLERCAFPDTGIYRLPRVVKRAYQLHRRFRFDAIFSSGMPFSDHLTALAVRRLIARPWVADFRDPWVEYVHWQQWNSPAGRRLTTWAEAAVVRNAARVIGVNNRMVDRFMARYPHQPARKFQHIPNGYDPADFPKIGTVQEQPKQFQILYAGSLYQTRAPDAMLEAFRRFLSDLPSAQRNVRFDFMGRPGPHLEKLANFAFPEHLCYRGFVPHREALRAMCEADLNVVLLPRVPGGEGDSTAKIYECIGSGRPILAAVPLNGAAADELRGLAGVSLCEPDDVNAITAAFHQWHDRWRGGHASPARPENVIKQHTRRNQAQLLARCFEEAVRDPRCKGGVFR